MIELHSGQITDLLGSNMRYNPETIAMGYAVLQEKQRLMELADRTRLMSQVETLDERTLDYLAVELRTPAYHDGFPLEVKRRLIAVTLPFYARLGTPAAVEWIINAIYGTGRIEEWFQYGGDPHHFRISIIRDHTIGTLEDFYELIRVVFSAKRLSSWLDKIITTIYLPPCTLRIGGGVGAAARISLPLAPDEHDFRDMLHTGGTFSVGAAIPVPEHTAQLPATTILRTGGVCTMISNLSSKGE